MIEADADVEVLDKDVYIATVSEGGRLDMEMRLKRGRGYVSADKNFDEDLGIGFIPIDSVHSPVRKCNYTVEAARLGQITDYDKLTLEVWTNGSITPADSLGLAAKLLKDHMNIFINFEEEIETGTSSSDDRKPEIHNENLNRSVEELELIRVGGAPDRRTHAVNTPIKSDARQVTLGHPDLDGKAGT
jgi:DNA-directed RNA polymerase subunit alpha